MRSIPMRLSRHLVLPLLLASVAGLVSGCGPSHRLADYSFDDRSVAVIAAIPPGPRVMSGSWSEAFVDPYDPVGTVIRLGTATAKWEQARKAQARLDSAAARVDVAEIIARRTLAGSAPTLGLRPRRRPGHVRLRPRPPGLRDRTRRRLVRRRDLLHRRSRPRPARWTDAGDGLERRAPRAREG